MPADIRIQRHPVAPVPQCSGAGSLVKFKRFLFFTISLIVFFAPPGLSLSGLGAEQAQQGQSAEPPEKTLEELLETPVITAASKRTERAIDAPSSVSVVTADEIKKYGYRTLAEILEGVRGLYVTYDRNYSYLGIRGFNLGDYNSRVLILVDGHRLNNNLSDGGFIGREFILDVDLIEHVEVIRGPGSILYGNNAFFGVINVVTRSGRSMRGLGLEGSVEGGTFDTYQGRVTWGHQFDTDLEMLFSGSIYESAGPGRLFFKEFDLPATNNGIAEDADDEHSKSAFGTVRWRSLVWEGGFITREKGNPTAQYETAFNNRDLRTTDDRSYANLKYTNSFPDVVDVVAQVYYDRYEFTIGYPLPPFPLNRDANVGEWWGAELQLSKLLWDKHTISVGAEYRDDFRQEHRNFDVQTGTLYADLHRSTFNYGVYVQADIAVFTNLHLNAGVRYDQYGDVDPTANPRVALIYHPFTTSTLKAIYGTAFRAPNFYERFIAAGNPLVPETITSYELAYEQQIGEHLRSTVAGYYDQIDDLLRLDSGFVLRNAGGAQTLGGEFELEGRWANDLRARASYTIQDTTDKGTVANVPSARVDSPRHLAKLHLSIPLVGKKVFASAEFLYASERLTRFGTTADAFGIVNLTLFSQELIKGLDLSVGVYNLLDRDYSDPATPFHKQDLLARDGRTFRLKATYRF
jgi:outer membrane receptor for ferrienterochelin and colicins